MKRFYILAVAGIIVFTAMNLCFTGCQNLVNYDCQIDEETLVENSQHLNLEEK